jgi:predicted nucleic acid-binding Zn ribbon protein
MNKLTKLLEVFQTSCNQNFAQEQTNFTNATDSNYIGTESASAALGAEIDTVNFLFSTSTWDYQSTRKQKVKSICVSNLSTFKTLKP